MTSDRERIVQLMRRLKTAPYLSARRILRRSIKPVFPRFVYKYKTLDPMNSESVQHVKAIILDSRLWLSSPADFNDPFDMRGCVTIDGGVKQREKRLSQLVNANLAHLNWKQRESKVREMMTKTSDELAGVVTASHNKVVERVGVCSFSNDPRNILMWSHYADCHTGICIQFDVARDPITFLEAISVEYSEDYPVINWLEDSAQQLKKVLLRKHLDWSYEEERRIVRIDSAKTPIEFSTDAVSAVILGCRATTATEALVRDFVEERRRRELSVPMIYRTGQHNRKYKLVIRKIRS
jgi:hypothetical protein